MMTDDFYNDDDGDDFYMSIPLGVLQLPPHLLGVREVNVAHRQTNLEHYKDHEDLNHGYLMVIRIFIVLLMMFMMISINGEVNVAHRQTNLEYFDDHDDIHEDHDDIHEDHDDIHEDHDDIHEDGDNLHYHVDEW